MCCCFQNSYSKVLMNFSKLAVSLWIFPTLLLSGHCSACEATIIVETITEIPAKFRLIQVFYDLIFAILGCSFHNLSPSTYVNCQVECCFVLLFATRVPTMPTLHDFPSEGHCACNLRTTSALIRLWKHSLLLWGQFFQVCHQWCTLSLKPHLLRTTPINQYMRSFICDAQVLTKFAKVKYTQNIVSLQYF